MGGPTGEMSCTADEYKCHAVNVSVYIGLLDLLPVFSFLKDISPL